MKIESYHFTKSRNIFVIKISFFGYSDQDYLYLKKLKMGEFTRYRNFILGDRGELLGIKLRIKANSESLVKFLSKYTNSLTEVFSILNNPNKLELDLSSFEFRED